MSTPRSGKTYNIINVGNDGRLNLFSLGKVSNGMNVVLYEDDGTDEQKWIYDDSRLFISTNSSYCLDRYNYSGNSKHNNADIWEASFKEADNQRIRIIADGKHFKIRLSSTNLYLTANKGLNGTKNGNTVTSQGNVYWDLKNNSSYQEWDFKEIKSSDGDNTGSGKGNGTIREGSFPSTFNPHSACYNNQFDRGQCTWYCYGRALEVMNKKILFDIPNGRHGKYWYEHVTNCSQLTKNNPVANSIAVWDNGGKYGHVGYVEKVSGEYVYISEANWDLDGENPNPETDGIIRRFTISDIKSRKTKYNGTYKLVGYLEL